MNFPIYRPSFVPGQGDKHLSLLNPSVGLTRPVMGPSQILPDNALQRFLAGPPAGPMLVLPSTGMVQHQQQPAHNLLAFQHQTLSHDSNPQAGLANNGVLSVSLSSLCNDTQNFMNSAGNQAYQGMNFGVPPPNVAGVSGIQVCPSTNFPVAPVLQQPPPPPMVANFGKFSPQTQQVPNVVDLSDHEVDPDQPNVDPQRTTLDFFNSDLHLEISKSGYEAKNIVDPPGFCFCWAGVRASYGVCTGKVFFEARIVENLKVDFGDDHEETNPFLLRIGWSMNHTSLQLGEEPDSWGYGGTGKFSTNNKFASYGEVYALGDVVAALLDLESKPPTISFAKNGNWLGVASPLYGHKVGCPEKALFPHILSKNCRFEVNFGQQPAWCPLFHMGHMFIDYLPVQSRIRGSMPPKRKADCDMIMIVGLPGAGKTTWGLKMFRENLGKCYNIIGTDTLIDKMRVMGLPRKNNYHGRWEVLIQKATTCLNKLFLIAGRRRRNYILDQTNVYASARKRKMKYFLGFRRTCAIIQPEDDELKRREWKRTFEDGKVVPEDAVLEMKYNYSLPDMRDEYVDELMWIELNQQETHDIVNQYGEEARMKLPSRKRPTGADADSSGDCNKQRKMWEHQSEDVNSSTGIVQLALTSGSSPEFRFSYGDAQQHQVLGINEAFQSPPSNHPIMPIQQHPLRGFAPPGLPMRPAAASNRDALYENWDGRPRMPGSTPGLLQTPAGSNATSSIAVPDFSQPPPMIPVQADFNQLPPILQSQFPGTNEAILDPKWSQQRQDFLSDSSNAHCDVDIRSENHPGFGEEEPRRDVERVHPRGTDSSSFAEAPARRNKFDDFHRGRRGERFSRETEGHSNEGGRQEDWRPDRDSRRDAGGNYQGGRDRDGDRWSRKDGRPDRRSPERDPYLTRGRGRNDDRRNSREGSRDSRRWTDDREQRNGGRERASFQERSNRNRWEDGSAGDDRPHSGGPNRQHRSLLGDSPQPLLSSEMMENWKDASRTEGNSIFPLSNQHQRPQSVNPRFSGPRTNQPPPPLRGPRPMPPRVPPPSMGFRGSVQSWPRA